MVKIYLLKMLNRKLVNGFARPSHKPGLDK